MLKNGYYNGKIIGLEVKEFEKKDDSKQKFKKLEIKCQIFLDNNEVKILKLSYGIDFARKLFVGSGVPTSQAIGHKVKCYVGTKSIANKEGGISTFNVLRSILFLNENDEVIYNPNEKEDDDTTNLKGIDF